MDQLKKAEVSGFRLEQHAGIKWRQGKCVPCRKKWKGGRWDFNISMLALSFYWPIPGVCLVLYWHMMKVSGEVQTRLADRNRMQTSALKETHSRAVKNDGGGEEEEQFFFPLSNFLLPERLQTQRAKIKGTENPEESDFTWSISP